MSLGTPTGDVFGATGTGATIGVTCPATASGDLIFLFMAQQAASATVTWPTGFTDTGLTGASRTNEQLYAATKTADGTEGGTTLTVTTSATTKAMTAGVVVWPGAALDAQGGAADPGSTGSVVTCPSVACSENHEGVLTVSVMDCAATSTWTQDAALTQIDHAGGEHGALSVAMMVAYEADTGTAASTGTFANTWNGAVNHWVAATFVVKAAAGSTAATATGSLSLSGAAGATAPVTASGSLSLSGSTTAKAPATATGSITLSGTAAAGSPGVATATGSVTLAGSATGHAPVAAPTGALALTASATPKAPALASDAINLSGTVHVAGVYAWSEWDGVTETALTLDGEWDGTTITALTLDTVTP